MTQDEKRKAEREDSRLFLRIRYRMKERFSTAVNSRSLGLFALISGDRRERRL